MLLVLLDMCNFYDYAMHCSCLYVTFESKNTYVCIIFRIYYLRMVNLVNGQFNVLTVTHKSTAVIIVIMIYLLDCH